MRSTRRNNAAGAKSTALFDIVNRKRNAPIGMGAEPTVERVPALQALRACPGRSAARSDALQTRDRSNLWRSRISGAPSRANALHAVPRPGHETVRFGATNPRCGNATGVRAAGSSGRRFAAGPCFFPVIYRQGCVAHAGGVGPCRTIRPRLRRSRRAADRGSAPRRPACPPRPRSAASSSSN
jgi:hypothetical protein